jgi:hypothetical protein
MQVTEALSLKEYDAYCRKSLCKKIPNIQSKDYAKTVGDCLYDYSASNNPRLRPGVHPGESKARDLRGKNALLSDYFFYFGDKPVKIPEKFSILVRNGQGHQVHKNESIKHDFVDWITKFYKPNKLYGWPQVEVVFTKDGKSLVTCGPGCQPKNFQRKPSKHC